MNFIILGDKFQKRMKSKGCIGLIKVNQKNILQLQYRNIKNLFPSAKILYVCGFESKKLLSFIEKYKDQFPDLTGINNRNYELYNSAYSLYLALGKCDDECCILFGDNLLEYRHLSEINKTPYCKALIDRKNKNKLGCIINQNHNIENICYDLDNYLCEVYYISKDNVTIIKKILENRLYHNCFIFEIMNKLIDQIDIHPLFVNSIKKNRVLKYD
jgi:choline kinase